MNREHIFRVNEEFRNGTFHYELRLSKENLDYFHAGFPGGPECLVGSSDRGQSFYIYGDSVHNAPGQFREMPYDVDQGAFFINIGAPVPQLDFGYSRQDFDKAADLREKYLNLSLSSVGHFPLLLRAQVTKKPFGYASIVLDE